MAAGESHGRGSSAWGTQRMTFELERFAWAGPDRLEVSGTFAGLRHAPDDDPVLVVSGGDGSHDLVAVPGSLSGPPEDGRPWSS